MRDLIKHDALLWLVGFQQLRLVHFDPRCFTHRDPHYYTHRVKEVIHIRLHNDNINRDSGIEIPEACMPTIKKKTQQQESRAIADRRGSKSLSETARIKMHQSELLKTNQP